MRKRQRRVAMRWSNTARVVSAFVILSSLLLAIFLGERQEASAQLSRSVVWDRYDVTIDLNADGSLHVTERQVVHFIGGSFSSGFADIPMGRIDSIENVEVTEITPRGPIRYDTSSCCGDNVSPNEYTWDLNGGFTSIVWGFERTSDSTRTFVIEYDAIGALRVYPDNDPPSQQIWWTAIAREVTDIAPVRASTVTINLPVPVNLADVVMSIDDVKVLPNDIGTYTKDGKSWTWTKQGMEEGDQFFVRLDFPSLVQAAAPRWQQADDDRRRKEEEAADRRALLNSLFLGAGLLGVVGGGIAVYGLWYFRGRDPHTGLVSEFLSTPPDDLPPGAAGALIDEVVHQRDIVATLVDLSRRGVIAMNQTSPSNFSGDVEVTLVDASKPIAPFEKEALNAIFSYHLQSGSTAKLWNASSKFAQAAPSIRALLYDELVQKQYFGHSPEDTRNTWRNRALRSFIWLPILGLITWLIFFRGVDWFWLPVGVLATMSVAIYLISGALPRKTPAGAEAAAKWLAFRRYLDRVDDFENVSEKHDIFDTYLPYAIAFGLEESWVTAFARADTPAPAWYAPIWRGGALANRSEDDRRHDEANVDWGSVVGRSWWDVTGGDQHTESTTSGDGGRFNLPDWQGTSDHAGRALSRVSDGMLSMFNSAGNALSSMADAAADSDWGSSGSSGSRRSSSGSRRSFSGGGSRGGSSGGGRRGFR